MFHCPQGVNNVQKKNIRYQVFLKAKRIKVSPKSIALMNENAVCQGLLGSAILRLISNR